LGIDPINGKTASLAEWVQKISPQFRFLNESLITKGQPGLVAKLGFDNRTGGSFAGLGILEVSAPED